MTRTPLSRSKGERSRSPGRFTHRRVNASGSSEVIVGTYWPWGNYCYIAICSAARGASAPTEGGEGRGISWRPSAYSLFKPFPVIRLKTCKHEHMNTQNVVSKPYLSRPRRAHVNIAASLLCRTHTDGNGLKQLFSGLAADQRKVCKQTLLGCCSKIRILGVCYDQNRYKLKQAVRRRPPRYAPT